MSKIDEWYDKALEFYQRECDVEFPEEIIQDFTTKFYDLSSKEVNEQERIEFEDIISIFIMFDKISLLDTSKISSKNDIILKEIFKEFEIK